MDMMNEMVRRGQQTGERFRYVLTADGREVARFADCSDAVSAATLHVEHVAQVATVTDALRRDEWLFEVGDA
jgi:hypothetical protein